MVALLDDYADDEYPVWLFRGVPAEAPEVEDVRATGEIDPPRPDRVGPNWRDFHVAGNTDTAYTSWTSDRSIAVDAAEWASRQEGLTGRTVILRVRFESIDRARVFDGRADEWEYLIEGTVEGVEISESDEDDE